MSLSSDVFAVAERVDERLAASTWDLSALDQQVEPDVEAAAEVAVFALKLAGKRRQARRSGRFGRIVVRFALAACLVLTSFAAACDKPDASPEATAVAISELASVPASNAAITLQSKIQSAFCHSGGVAIGRVPSRPILRSWLVIWAWRTTPGIC